MYYILTTIVENDDEDAILEGGSDYLIRIDCSFQEGLSLPSEDIETPILFKFYADTLRGTMTDHLSINAIPGPVFSLKVKNVFDKIGVTNIEYYQLKLLDEFSPGKKEGRETKKTIEYTDFFIANVVGLVDCVNHEKSVLEYFYPPELRNLERENTEKEVEINNPFAGENPNDIDFITKLVFDESRMDPLLKVFRLKDRPNLLIFHESIVELIKKEKLSGFVFVPVEKYTDAIVDDDQIAEVIKEPEQQKQILTQPKPKEDPIPPQPTEEPKEKKKGRFSFLSDKD